MKNYYSKIKQGLENREIVVDGLNVKFKDGYIIGGVMAETQEELIDIINKCLNREDFSIPGCLQ